MPYTSEVLNASRRPPCARWILNLGPAGPLPHESSPLGGRRTAAPPLFALPFVKKASGARGVLLVSKTAVPTNVTLHGAGLAGAGATVLDGSVDGVVVDAEPGFVAPVERIVSDDGFLALGPFAIALVNAGSSLVEGS